MSDSDIRASYMKGSWELELTLLLRRLNQLADLAIEVAEADRDARQPRPRPTRKD